MNTSFRTRREESFMCHRVGLLNTTKITAERDFDAIVTSLLDSQLTRNTPTSQLNSLLIDLRHHVQSSTEACLKISANYSLVRRIVGLFTLTAHSDLVLASAELLVTLCAQSSPKVKVKLAKLVGPYLVCYLSCGHHGLQTRVVWCLGSLCNACPAACLCILRQGAADELSQLLLLQECTLQMAVVNALLCMCNCGQIQRDAVMASGLLLKNLEHLLRDLILGERSDDSIVAMELLANATLLLWYSMDAHYSNAEVEKLVVTLCVYALTQESASLYFFHLFIIALGRCLNFSNQFLTNSIHWPSFSYLLLHCALRNRCARLELLLALNNLLSHLPLTETAAMLTDSTITLHLALIYESVPLEKSSCGVAALHLIARVLYSCISAQNNMLSVSLLSLFRPSVVISVTTALLASRDAVRMQPALRIMLLYFQLANDPKIIQRCRLDMLLISQLWDVAALKDSCTDSTWLSATCMCNELLTFVT